MSLEIKKLKKSYTDTPIFNDFNLSLEEKKINCILGISGIGKTTLLNIVSGITDADSGDISDFKNKSFSYIFQEPRVLEWKTVFGNIFFVLKDIYPKEETEARANRYISMVGLADYKNYYPEFLSGGMQQRVSIARAFAYPSDILIMDEPFKSLDLKLKKNLINSFIDLWQSDKRTVIFVTHDVEEAAYIGDRIFILTDIMPAGIKKVICIEIPQKERLSDYSKIRDLKRNLIDSLF
ncbi:MAG: ABC transporter ATP-binding protein [Actinobacteria bacterium]|nr:ABC transporter ATP-binding protein [Actinomycetota bacterium]